MARSRSNTRATAHSYPRGTLTVMRGGYGFVMTAEGEYYVSSAKLNGAFDGDLVEISPLRQERSKKALKKAASSDRKHEARVKRVIEHAHAEVVGRYEVAEPFGVVVPEDPGVPYDIFTMRSENPAVPDGAIVRVAMLTYPSRKEAATGRIVEVLGDGDDERLPVDLIVARYNLETEFSEAALREADGAVVDEDGALAEGYRDLRDRFVFTIDPVDARDFDDAVSLDEVVLGPDGFEPKPAEGGVQGNPDEEPSPQAGKRCWRLGVHIADVSHYVSWASAVDLDARKRATSVYLVDRVVAMLPEALSNDVCSLRPDETRRSMTVDLYMDDRGDVISSEAYPALIRSRARLTYEQAQSLLDAPDPPEALPGLSARLRGLSELANRRRALRQRAGGIDFDTVEAKVTLDSSGVPVDIVLRERTCATQLIEEAMIAANEAVARQLRDAGYPCMYRVHEKPSHDSLESLVPVLQEFSWFKDISKDRFVAGNPHVIARVLDACSQRPEGPLVTTLVLRSMKRAHYSAELDGHYALASDAYAHFTSPIRRYPDLVVHRMLKALLHGRPKNFDQQVANMQRIAEHSSEMERVAEKAARESQEVKIAEFMEASIGQAFSAMVSGVASCGLFVKLDNTAEGLIPIGDLGREYFVLDAVRHTLTGSDTGRQYQLGKRLAVRLVEVDRRTRELRFRLI